MPYWQLLLLLAFTALTSAPALSKEVVLEWAPVKHAAVYEVRVERAGKTHIHRHLNGNSYTGKLDPGVYTWQVRAMDRLKRPGQWSPSEPLVVMAAAPEPVSPASGIELKVYDPEEEVRFIWKRTSGAALYLFELAQNGVVQVRREVRENELLLQALPAGKYSWSVRPVLLPEEGSVLPEKRWEGPSASPANFTLSHPGLAEAHPVIPRGVIPFPSSSKVTFEWSPVQGAKEYEITLSSATLPGETEPITRSWRSSTTSLEVPLTEFSAAQGDRTYSWSVRPLASARALASATQSLAVSHASFQFSREMKDLLSQGILEFSTLVSPTSFQFFASDSGYTGNNEAVSSSMRMSGVYYGHSPLGIGVSFENTALRIAERSFSLAAARVEARYRLPLPGLGRGWTLHTRLGGSYREYLQIFPSVNIDTVSRTVSITGTDDTKVQALGLTMGADLKRQISDQWAVQLGLGHELPLLKLGSSDVTAMETAGLTDHLSVGARLSWEPRSWGVSLGALHERRRIRFTRTPAAGASSSGTDESTSSAWSLLGGVSYSFY